MVERRCCTLGEEKYHYMPCLDMIPKSARGRHRHSQTARQIIGVAGAKRHTCFYVRAQEERTPVHCLHYTC
eukprot:12588-Eustigmatos_ZCMA.PRE.1